MNHRRAALPWTVAATVSLFASVAVGEIRDARCVPAETLDLTGAGTIDWCVYQMAAGDAPTFAASDTKRGGEGIGREIALVGRLSKAERTRWTGVGWGWTDGAPRAAHTHRQGDSDGDGFRAWLPAQAGMRFGFAPGPAERVACVLFRAEGRLTVTARQGRARRAMAKLTGGKRMLAAVVRYSGPEPLTIALANPGNRDSVVRGIAAALGSPEAFADGPPGLPTRQELAARKAEALGEIHHLARAAAFADCMIRHGRDRYGDVHSPLFAVLLLRTSPPRIGPQPVFDRPCPYDTSRMATPFRLHHYNRLLNYPPKLGGEGPHKVTVTGCDPYEDRAMYEFLIDLSRITGEPRYRDEAIKALRWWFANTMGPAGLYPWGEHLGWDFEHECPTYFAGPSKHLYAACYHEIKDRVPFLEVLSAMPAPAAGGPTLLERYAFGVWEAHYWDQDRALYCRHGDYTGADDRTGSLAGFPAHQGAHLRLWTAALLHARNAAVRDRLADILRKVLDVQIARAETYGFVPFTFDPDVKGTSPGKKTPGQSLRLARHAAELSATLRDRAKDLPDGLTEGIAARLHRLAALHLSEADLAAALSERPSPPSKKPAADVADLSRTTTPGPHAKAIRKRVEWFRLYGDAAYLAAAERQAALACVQFLDEASPLPKAFAGQPPKTVGGEAFGSFYFRGASLMHAMALLGEARRDAGR